MRNSFWFLFLCCVVTRQSSCSFVGERTKTCQNSSTVKGHTMIVQHEKPSPLRVRTGTTSGTVLIKATVLPGSIDKGVSTCEWTFNVDGSKKIKTCNTPGILKENHLKWKFKEPGLKKINVVVNFFLYGDAKLLRNCTFINVTDCSRQINLTVTTSTSSFNVSKHREVILDSPGMVNFSVLVFNIVDPFYMCWPLYYKWSFGDGQYLSNMAGNKVNHFYNSSGSFLTVLNIFKDKDRSKFYKNISVTVCVKEKPSAHGNLDTGTDVTLVLAILAVVIFVLVICVAIFRKRVHRFTEVARFDFRDRDFPSVDTTVFYKQGCCSNLFSGNGKENQYLLDSDPPFSSRMSFGSALPTEEF